MKKLFLLIGVIGFFTACNQPKQQRRNTTTVSKSSLNDSFAKSVVESQYFDVSTEKDTIIEGKQGAIVVLPKLGFVKES